MSCDDFAALDAVLGGSELAWIRQRAREHLTAGRLLPARMTLREPSDGQRRAYAELVGRPLRLRGPLAVTTSEIDSVLRQSGIASDGLVSALELLEGPIARRTDVEREQREAWDAAFTPLFEAVAARADDAATGARLAVWLDDLRIASRRLGATPDDAREPLAALVRVVEALPTPPEPLARFAARTLDSAHALDDDRPLAGIAVRAAAAIGGVAPPEAGVVDAAWRRRAWASVGVVRDELSSTVLVLGMPGDPRTVTGQILEQGRAAGEPLVLTLRQLRDVVVPDSLGGTVVSCCENPSVVAASAEALGARCAPLVCTAGQPGAAVTALLRSCSDVGARLRHHGDFDPSGVGIMALLQRRHGVGPWRFGAEDYAAAVTMRPAVPRAWLTDVALTTPWDLELAAVMRTAGVKIEEEMVLDGLLADLERS